MPRNCTVCRHVKRREIEDDLQAGLPYPDVARRYGVSKDAASRHRASHVPLHTAPAVATVSKIMTLLNQAETATTWNATLLTVRETRLGMEDLMMLLTSELETDRKTASDCQGSEHRYLRDDLVAIAPDSNALSNGNM
jgi:hypothetical protein